MTIIQSLLLGLLQGVAEFLPISSSGHLILAQHLFHLDDVPLLFDVVLHVATLAAVVLYFRHQVIALLGAFIRWITVRPLLTGVINGGGSTLVRTDYDSRRTVQAVIFGMIATGGIGVVLEKTVKTLPPRAVCALFLMTAAVLVAGQAVPLKRGNSGGGQHNGRANCLASPGLGAAIIIGMAQGIGVLPGLSRSGVTISAALLCGLNAEAAGEFSFILSIPAILGAFVLQLKDLKDIASIGALPVALGAVAAFIAGYLSLSFLMRLIKRGHLAWFALYLLCAGIAGMIYFGG